MNFFLIIIAALLVAQNTFAFEPFIPESAIFNFHDRERISLEKYNEIYLASRGKYENIEFDPSDASFGERLTLDGFSMAECYQIALAAYLPLKYHEVLSLPKETGITSV